MKTYKLKMIDKTTLEVPVDMEFEYDKNYDVSKLKDNIVASIIVGQTIDIPIEDIVNSDAFKTVTDSVSMERVNKQFNIYLTEV